MRSTSAKLALGVTAFALVSLAAPFPGAGVAEAHGYTQEPPSRQAVCAAGNAGDCGPIQYEPQSAEGPGGFPQAGPPDGQLCSAGKQQFGQLDDPRGGTWPAAPVTAGQTVQARWTNTASHPTRDYRYFVTKDGWDPTKPLTREQLEPAPFAVQDYGGRTPGTTESHPITLPHKKGKQVIVGVWDIADTSNAFYSCSDVDFH